MKAFLKNQKNHKDVVQLSFNENELKQVYWEEEDEEFSFKGNMYDVIEKKIEENHVTIRCIQDKKETALLNEYQKHNKHNSSNSTIAQLIITQFLLPVDYSINPPERQIKKHYQNHFFPLQTIASTIILPPPNAC